MLESLGQIEHGMLYTKLKDVTPEFQQWFELQSTISHKWCGNGG